MKILKIVIRYLTKNFVNFLASTFLAPYLHKFSVGVQIMLLFCYFGQICIKFSAISASKFKKIMQKQHLLILSRTNLVGNISTEALF